MNSETEPQPQQCSTSRLPLLPIPPMQSPERSGMVTPPLQTLASVPFRWEEEPGRPRPCTSLTTVSEFTNKCLELPPRLLMEAKISNLPSPTTVLDGPYVCSRPTTQSSSFRTVGKDCYGSFSLQRTQLSSMVLAKGSGFKDRGWFGSWKKKSFKGKKELNGSSHVFPSFLDKDREDSVSYTGTGFKDGDAHRTEVTTFKRSGSFSSVSRAKSHFWTTICDGLKQVVPWKSKKLKKDGHGLILY